MMSRHCTDEQLIEFALGELTGVNQLVVASHVMRCDRCARRATLFRQGLTALEDALAGDRFATEAHSAEAWRQLQRKIGEYDRSRANFRRHGLAWASGIAAVCLLAVITAIVMLWGRRTHDLRPAEALARAQQAEDRVPQGVLHQRFEVEVAHLGPQRQLRRWELEAWFDGQQGRSAWRWRGSGEMRERVIWTRWTAQERVSYVWAGTDSLQSIRWAGEPEAHSDLEALQSADAEALADALFQWVLRQSWKPLLLSRTFWVWIGQESSMLVLRRPTATQSAIELWAKRPWGSGTAEFTLRIELPGFQPREFCLRLQTGAGVVELRIRRQQLEVVRASYVDPEVFVPRVLESPGRLAKPSATQTAVASGSSTSEVAFSASEALLVETRIRWTLHELGWCTEDWAEFEVQPKRLLVQISSSSPTRAQQISAALQALELPPWVELRIGHGNLDKGIATGLGAAQLSSPMASAAFQASVQAVPLQRSLPLQRELEDYFARRHARQGVQGSAERQELARQVTQFSNSAVRQAVDLLQEAWELRRLAERYGPQRGVPMEVRRLVQLMVAGHARQLEHGLARYRALVQPVLEQIALQRSLQGSLEAGGQVGAAELGTWVEASLEVFRQVNALYEDTLALMAVPMPGEEGPKLHRPVEERLSSLWSLMRLLPASLEVLVARVDDQVRAVPRASPGALPEQ